MTPALAPAAASASASNEPAGASSYCPDRRAVGATHMLEAGRSEGGNAVEWNALE